MTHSSQKQAWALALAWLALAVAAKTQVTETVLRNFQAPSPNGASPYATVVMDPAGNLYGTSYAGGAANQGLVYKVDTSGQQTVLYSFTGGADGGKPQAGVILDAAHNLYGTTSTGGASNAGVVYKISGPGKETVMYSFTGKLDGGVPLSGLLLDSTGNLYGTASKGGAYQAGVLFKLSPSGQQTVLFSFIGGASGNAPSGQLARDTAGNFYGTTAYGGTTLQQCSHPPSGCGVVYKIDSSGHETVLHTFVGESDGADPLGGVIRDAQGNLYGTAYYGGAYGFGNIFEISPAGREMILYAFTGGNDGGNPQAGVIRDAARNLYGTTINAGPEYGGVVYKLDTAGHETVLHSFKSYGGGYDGYYPYAGVTLDSAGNIYGTTKNGGPAGFGALFKLDPAGQETIMACFNGAPQGNTPQGAVSRDNSGNLYGTTYYGGPNNAGLVYKISNKGPETVLYSFTGGTDGGNPSGSLTLDPAGNLYGVTVHGGNGQSPAGVVYKIPPGGGEAVLYTFPGGAGGQPGLARDGAGNLYGTISAGGSAPGCTNIGCGSVYKLDPTGMFTTLYEFSGGVDGKYPNGNLILDSAGNLYGTTQNGGTANCGPVFKLDPSGNETVLYTFTGCGGGPHPDGGIPTTGVVRDIAGNLYGANSFGGATGYGTAYKLDPAGQETILYSFTAYTGVFNPYSGLILDGAGNLYGTTYGGGVAPCSCGTVYQINSSGAYSVLYNFTGAADGGFPEAPVLLDPSGNLYGTTTAAGTSGGGVLFKLQGPASH